MFPEKFKIYLSGLNSLISAIAFFILGYSFWRFLGERKIRTAEKKAQKLIEDAEKELKAKKQLVEVTGKEEIQRLTNRLEKEIQEKQKELNILNKRLMQKEEILERRLDAIEKQEKEIIVRREKTRIKEQELSEKEKKILFIIEEKKKQLERISKLSREEAKQLLLSQLVEEAKYEAAKQLKEIEEETKELAEKKAKNIIALAIQKTASKYVGETTISVVSLPNEEMKGRIIGREGRNIRTFEMETGIDLIVDDTPEAIVLSGFDAIKREIARIALEELIADGRIHPTRIEEVVRKTKQEIFKSIQETGEKVVFDMKIYNLHPEITNLLGRLKYRTSFGQNVLQHSLEVAQLSFFLASELSVDANLAKRAGLIHDIGKAIDQDVEGTHAQIGADLVKKYGESKKIIHIIKAHHEEIEAQIVEAILVQAADTLSSARPGARHETLETYIKRIEKLEQLASSFPGIEKSYAIQAGREIRIMVEPTKIDDVTTAILANDIKKKIEKELEYPGQIKITVIRELRVTDVAK